MSAHEGQRCSFLCTSASVLGTVLAGTPLGGQLPTLTAETSASELGIVLAGTLLGEQLPTLTVETASELGTVLAGTPLDGQFPTLAVETCCGLAPMGNFALTLLALLAGVGVGRPWVGATPVARGDKYAAEGCVNDGKVNVGTFVMLACFGPFITCLGLEPIALLITCFDMGAIIGRLRGGGAVVDGGDEEATSATEPRGGSTRFFSGCGGVFCHGSP